MDYDLVPVPFSNLVKIKFVSKKLSSQRAYARGANQLNVDESDRNTWTFIAPEELQENVSHTWDTYESLASRLSSKVGEIHTALTDLAGVKAAAGGGMGAIKPNEGQSFASTETIKNVVSSAVRESAKVDVPAYRVDTAMVYKDSSRLEYSLTMTLADMNGDPYNSIVRPVRELEKLSCPEMADDTILINFPYIFQVYTVGSEIINVKNAAIINIAPLWKGPIINNYYSMCELTIIFRDIEPLYRSTFSKGGIIRTSTSQPQARTDLTNGFSGR